MNQNIKIDVNKNTKFNIGDNVYYVATYDRESYLIRKANILGIRISLQDCYGTHIDEYHIYEITYRDYNYADENETTENNSIKIVAMHAFARREQLFLTQFKAIEYICSLSDNEVKK